MLGRWSHAHASIKRCAWIKRSDGISLQHLKRILSKYILILQRTISILKLSPLDDASALGISVWPMISGSVSPYLMSPNIRSMSFSGVMSPNIRPLSTATLEELRPFVPLSLDAKSSSISSFASPHLAGKLRPGSAGMLRPVSAMAQTSFTTNESHTSTVTAAFLIEFSAVFKSFVCLLMLLCLSHPSAYSCQTGSDQACNCGVF
jgi:hypothetical protein